MAYAESLTALADPTRRRVFECVARGPNSVATLAAQVPVSRPAVSQHLKVLSDAGLLDVRTQGTLRIYSVRRAGLAELRAYLDQFWEDVLARFAEDIHNNEGRSDD